MTDRLVVAVALLLLTAGCSGAADSGAPTTTPAGPTTTPGATSTQTPTTAAAPTETPTPESPIDNPFDREPVRVSIEGDGTAMQYEQLRRSVNYWRENGAGHTRWQPNLMVVENDSADIYIQFNEDIERCGTHDTTKTLGCAPVLGPESEIIPPERIQVLSGLTANSTYKILRHELGHILGLEHGEGPNNAMAPYARAYYQVIMIHVSVEDDSADMPPGMRHATDYYQEGADGFLSENVSFVYADSREQAGIVVEVRTNERYSAEAGSMLRYNNSKAIIDIDGIHPSTVSWHVGYWLGVYFGAESTDDLPPPFDDPEQDRRSAWWLET